MGGLVGGWTDGGASHLEEGGVNVNDEGPHGRTDEGCDEAKVVERQAHARARREETSMPFL